MRSIALLCNVLILAAACTATGAEGAGDKAPKPELKTLSEKFSYMVGADVARSLKKFKADLDLKALMRGVEDGLAGKKPILSPEEAKATMQAMQEQATARIKTDGAAFLAANKKKKGVVTTKSGLQYAILKKGDGPKPSADDVVRVHYRGTLIDGTEFDSSYKRGKPVTFRVKGVIAGWTEALQLMNVGTKCKLFIPSELAYGKRGAGRSIPPDASLVFEVELLGIDAPAKPK